MILGYADAEEQQTRLRLAHAINEVIIRRGLSQAATAGLLGIKLPKVSSLAHYKLDGFSVERLKPRSRAAGRISAVE